MLAASMTTDEPGIRQVGLLHGIETWPEHEQLKAISDQGPVVQGLQAKRTVRLSSAKPSNSIVRSEKKIRPKYSCPWLMESGFRLVRKNKVATTSDCELQRQPSALLLHVAVIESRSARKQGNSHQRHDVPFDRQ
jgi:hypothetical protein